MLGMVINLIVGVYIPIIRIPVIKGGMTISQDTLPETKPTSLYLKMDAWKTSLSFWVSAYFQARAVRFREGIYFGSTPRARMQSSPPGWHDMYNPNLNLYLWLASCVGGRPNILIYATVGGRNPSKPAIGHINRIGSLSHYWWALTVIHRISSTNKRKTPHGISAFTYLDKEEDHRIQYPLYLEKMTTK